MEGQFDGSFKTGRHPHTNMAKAALNMITRTCAESYAERDVHVNSVDTGWVTNEAPHPVAARMSGEGLREPLDAIDGAARVLDPVFVGVHHLARFTFMSLVLPAAVGVIRAYEGTPTKPRDEDNAA